MTVIGELHQDHVNLSKLLKLLERNLEEVGAGSAPNFLLVSEIAAYIEDYVKRHHHPREDRLFAYFRGRDAELDRVMARCEQEHLGLEREGRSLVEIMAGAMHDALVPIGELVARAGDFVRDEKAHLDFEERQVFPGVSAIANADDWARLEETLGTPVNDPVFGRRETDRYAALHQELLSSRGDDA